MDYRKNNYGGVLYGVVNTKGELVEQNAPGVPVKNLITQRMSLNPVQSVVQRFHESIFKGGIDLPVPRPDPAHIGERFSAKPNREFAHQSSDWFLASARLTSSPGNLSKSSSLSSRIRRCQTGIGAPVVALTGSGASRLSQRSSISASLSWVERDAISVLLRTAMPPVYTGILQLQAAALSDFLGQPLPSRPPPVHLPRQVPDRKPQRQRAQHIGHHGIFSCVDLPAPVKRYP